MSNGTGVDVDDGEGVGTGVGVAVSTGVTVIVGSAVGWACSISPDRLCSSVPSCAICSDAHATYKDEERQDNDD